MKKIFASLLAFSLLALNTLPALAYQGIADVEKDYWAQKEIASVVSDNIMNVDASTYFYPEESISRVEFVKALLKLLTNDNLDVKIKNKFSDVSVNDPDYNDILRSEQLGLVYGYPNGTFQPSRTLMRAEAQSVVSHITKEQVSDETVLDQFSDFAAIPVWAKQVYAKTIAYGIYVNYPDAKELRPNQDLTKAEAAVLLYQLKDKISLVKKEYVGKDLEKLLAIEHLVSTKKAQTDVVKITNTRTILTEGNVLLVSFDSKFKSQHNKFGDTVYFQNKENISTREGTVIFPANTKFEAKITEIREAKWFNKNARVYLEMDKAVFPDGTNYNISAKPFYKNYELKEGPWMTAGKLALSTITMGAIGTGAGIGLGFIPNPAKIGTGAAIGAPVGAAVGLIIGLVTPGLNYNAKEGEQIMVIFLNDLNLPAKENSTKENI